MRKFTQLAILAIIPFGLFAARITLRDGSTINGRFLSGTEDRIVVQDDSGLRRTFNINEVQTVDFNDTIAPAYNRDSDRRDDSANRRDDSANRVDNRRVWTTLPAGAQISVRTDQTIQADAANEGRTFP